jgi:hypothetical protein
MERWRETELTKEEEEGVEADGIEVYEEETFR